MHDFEKRMHDFEKEMDVFEKEMHDFKRECTNLGGYAQLWKGMLKVGGVPRTKKCPNTEWIPE